MLKNNPPRSRWISAGGRGFGGLRGELVQCLVDLVELPQPALDLAIDLAVELRAGHALCDQADELVHGLELVGEPLDPAHALVAMAHPAQHDLATPCRAIRVWHRQHAWQIAR